MSENLPEWIVEQIGFGIRAFLSVCTEMSLPIKTNDAGRGRNNIACQAGIFGQIQRNGSVKLVVTALQYQVINFFLKCFGAGRLGYYCSKGECSSSAKRKKEPDVTVETLSGLQT